MASDRKDRTYIANLRTLGGIVEKDATIERATANVNSLDLFVEILCCIKYINKE